jgi:hypothetical protein
MRSAGGGSPGRGGGRPGGLEWVGRPLPPVSAVSDLMALWRPIAEHPADAGRRLILCDWLADREAEARDPGRARALAVLRAGQQWQAANGRRPVRADPHQSPERPPADEWVWYRTNVDMRAHSPARIPGELHDQLAGCRTGPGTGLVFDSLPAAEWALAVALDRHGHEGPYAGVVGAALRRYGWEAMSRHADFPRPERGWVESDARHHTIIHLHDVPATADWHPSRPPAPGDFERHDTRLDRVFAVHRYGYHFRVVLGVCHGCGRGWHRPVEVRESVGGPAYMHFWLAHRRDESVQMIVPAVTYEPPALAELAPPPCEAPLTTAVAGRPIAAGQLLVWDTDARPVAADHQGLAISRGVPVTPGPPFPAPGVAEPTDAL